MMKNFLNYVNEDYYLFEEKGQAIKHLTHLAGEEHFYGKDRAEADIDRLENLHNYLKGEKSTVSRVGVKADGSPAFQMGHVINPKTGEREFGVAYKGATKGYMFNQKDVDENFGDKPGLHSKISQLVQHGGKVMSPIHGVVQGDFMGSKQDGTIFEDGDNISHKEQLIKYSVPKNSDEGKKLKRSKISVALHTKIDGDDREYNIDTSKFYDHPDVHIFNNKFDRQKVNYDEDTQKEFEGHVSKAKEHLSQLRDHDGLVEGHSEHLQTYINKNVREGTDPTVQGYRSHLQTRLQKDVDKVKTPAVKQKKQDMLDGMLDHVDDNKDQFTTLFSAHKKLDQAKNVLREKLEMSGQNQIHTINDHHAMPEGFVAGYQDGSVSKIVNRSAEGFSGLNLNK